MLLDSDLLHGEEVHNILEKCPWWAAFKGIPLKLVVASFFCVCVCEKKKIQTLIVWICAVFYLCIKPFCLSLPPLNQNCSSTSLLARQIDICWLILFLDQRHDLFITSTATAGYLTGPTASVAGYLTVCRVSWMKVNYDTNSNIFILLFHICSNRWQMTYFENIY